MNNKSISDFVPQSHHLLPCHRIRPRHRRVVPITAPHQQTHHIPVLGATPHQVLVHIQMRRVADRVRGRVRGRVRACTDSGGVHGAPAAPGAVYWGDVYGRGGVHAHGDGLVVGLPPGTVDHPGDLLSE